eukprot:1834402-Pyramimonas_sp.AAC.2
MTASATLSRIYDVTLPAASLSSAADTNYYGTSVGNTKESPIPIAISFTETILDSTFGTDDFTVTGGTAQSLTGSDR